MEEHEDLLAEAVGSDVEHLVQGDLLSVTRVDEVSPDGEIVSGGDFMEFGTGKFNYLIPPGEVCFHDESFSAVPHLIASVGITTPGDLPDVAVNDSRVLFTTTREDGSSSKTIYDFTRVVNREYSGIQMFQGYALLVLVFDDVEPERSVAEQIGL